MKMIRLLDIVWASQCVDEIVGQQISQRVAGVMRLRWRIVESIKLT